MKTMRTIRRFLALISLGMWPAFAFSQLTTVLQADGPGNTYELVNAVFGSGASSEVPDCFHAVRHIREEWDASLGRYVFLFDIHVDSVVDNDRCTNYDRQRNEIKTVSPSSITGQEGETHIYRWLFRMDSLFQPSPNFCHLHQIKATGGDDDGAPLMTITPRKYSDTSQPEWLQLIFTPSSGTGGGGTLKQVELLPFKGVWLEVTEKVLYSDAGKYEVTIRTPDSTVVMHYANYLLDMYRAGANFHRGKWGIYRSLNSPTYLRDETVAFADVSVTEGETNTPPDAPDSLRATAVSNRQVDLSWKDQSDSETNFLVQSSLDGAVWTTIGAVPADTAHFSHKGLADSTVYYYRVRAENWNAYSAFADSAVATTPSSSANLPESWFDGDIGAVPIPGYAKEESGTIMVEGSGSDIWGTSDQFHFVYRALSGDGSIEARVDTMTGPHEWAKAGVMIRATLSTNAPHAMAIVTPLHGVSFQRRVLAGGTSSSTAGTVTTPPRWVRLIRGGNVFTSFESADGIQWSPIGMETIPMATTVFAGLAVTSHTSGSLCIARISNVAMKSDTTGDPHIWVEAESVPPSPPMKVREDYLASSGFFIVTDTGKNTTSAPLDGRSLYAFHVASEGSYRLWTRVIAPTRDDDSFWLKVDDDPWIPWNEAEPSAEWTWDLARNSSAGDAVVLHDLVPGPHTLTVTYREDGTRIDKFLFTRDSTFNPNTWNGTTNVAGPNVGGPFSYVLYPAYPNPFNPSTRIRFDVPQQVRVTVGVYSLLGQRVALLVDGVLAAGSHEREWSARDGSGRSVSSGVYIVTLEAAGELSSRKLMLVR